MMIETVIYILKYLLLMSKDKNRVIAYIEGIQEISWESSRFIIFLSQNFNYKRNCYVFT